MAASHSTSDRIRITDHFDPYQRAHEKGAMHKWQIGAVVAGSALLVAVLALLARDGPSDITAARPEPPQVSAAPAAPTHPANPSSAHTARSEFDSPAVKAAPATPAAPLTVAQRYATATDKRALYNELRALDTGEAKYFAAKILSDCLEVSGLGYSEAQARFQATLPKDDPLASARLAAYSKLRQPCAGFSNSKLGGELTTQLYREAAKAGDPRAIAWILKADTLDPNDQPQSMVTARKLLETAGHDERVLSGVAAVLARQPGGLVIDGQPVGGKDDLAAFVAWQMVGCDRGTDCGPNSEPVLVLCAYHGVCTHSAPEAMQMVALPPADYQRALQFREKINNALTARDYVSLGLPRSGS